MDLKATKEDGPQRSWYRSLKVYLDRRQLAILLMGFSSGLPFALAGATLSWWLSRAGIDKTSIGLFALVALPYSLKFLWSPLFDHWRPPPVFRQSANANDGWQVPRYVLTELVWRAPQVPTRRAQPALFQPSHRVSDGIICVHHSAALQLASAAGRRRSRRAAAQRRPSC